MPKAHAQKPAGAPPESPHALQLQRGFPRLRFDPPLEEEFRQVHRAESLPQVRRNLWLGIIFLLAFSVLTHFVLPPATSRQIDLIRIGTDRKSTRLNSSHVKISYAVFCLKKKKPELAKTFHKKVSDDS